MVQGYLFNKPNPYAYIAERAKSGTGLHFETQRAGASGEKGART